MMHAAARSILVLSALSSIAAPAAHGQEKKPFELVRELQTFQDEAVLRNKDARAEQGKWIAKVAAQLSRYDASVWADPRNARAAVIYVLSGGDPRVLAKLVAARVNFGIDDRLVKGALAYGERRDADATELLNGVDVDLLDRSIGGHVALVRALLLAGRDQARAFALLDRARIIAPGTIVEEAALRRQAILAAKMDKLDTFEALSSQYFRRFANSIFVRSFERQFAHELLARGYVHDSERLAKLEALLRELPEAERKDTCLAIAEEGVAAANVEMVRFAARLAAIDAKAQPLDALRLKLFEAAVLILTADHEKAVATLRSTDRSQLGPREEALLNAALAVAREISRPPLPGPRSASAGAPEPGEPIETGNPSLIKNAQESMARVDKLLSEAPQ
jgi:chemotaxis protein MotC